MPKYTRKGLGDSLNQEVAREVLHAHYVEENESIQTPFGEALITAGNYILTNSNGEKVGITSTDLELNYTQED